MLLCCKQQETKRKVYLATDYSYLNVEKRTERVCRVSWAVGFFDESANKRPYGTIVTTASFYTKPALPA